MAHALLRLALTVTVTVTIPTARVLGHNLSNFVTRERSATCSVPRLRQGRSVPPFPSSNGPARMRTFKRSLSTFTKRSPSRAMSVQRDRV